MKKDKFSISLLKYDIMSTKVDFKYNDGSKLFWTSDSHFGHSNIIKFCDRPFDNIEEMYANLI